MPLSGTLGYVIGHLASFPGELLGLLRHVHFIFSDLQMCVRRAGCEGRVLQVSR